MINVVRSKNALIWNETGNKLKIYLKCTSSIYSVYVILELYQFVPKTLICNYTGNVLKIYQKCTSSTYSVYFILNLYQFVSKTLIWNETGNELIYQFVPVNVPIYWYTRTIVM